MGTRPAHPTYEDALTYLNSLQTKFAILEERRKKPPPDLKKNDALNEMLQWVCDIGYQRSDFDRLNPVHVAGTKGKGTTCAFVNSILAQSKARTQLPGKIGLFTSPHLLSVRERIRIDSKPVSEELFTRYFFEVWDRLEIAAERRNPEVKYKPAYLRYLTLLSLHIFMCEQVDVAVYEVGVGGEFDSTNVIAKPAVTGITALGIDHVQVLGATIEEIAWHKAGIFKTGAPAYTVRQPESAMEVLKQRAEEKRVALVEVPIAPCLRDVQIVPDEDFQKQNASLAVVLADRVLTKLGAAGGQGQGESAPSAALSGHRPLDIEQPLSEVFKAGLTSTVWRGRCETVETSYGKWLLDGAHTAESLEIVSDWFGRTVKQSTLSTSNGPLSVLVFNQQASHRDLRQLIETLQHRLIQKWDVRPQHAIFCTNVTYKTQEYKLDFVDANTDSNLLRGLNDQHEYARIWRQNDLECTTHVVASVEEAVETARDLITCSPGHPAYVLATGSFRLIGAVLTILEGEGIASEPSTTGGAHGESLVSQRL